MWYLAGYLLIGSILNMALAAWAQSANRRSAADEFFFSGSTLWLLLLWPVLVPLSVRKAFRAPPELLDSPPHPRRGPQLGKRGVSLTKLSPSGKVEIDGMSYPAIAENGFIKAGEMVIVSDQDDLRVRVRPDHRPTV
ncbi:MAG: NfeD family protein [Verrucomicrobiae bacterium]|nr:NfeD family protein [Verrucomicrobiae bacterium]